MMRQMLGFAVLVSALSAQTLPSGFEVADVRISKPGSTPKGDFLPGGKLILQYLTMRELVTAAWDLADDAFVTGGPAWIASEHYDIVAKAAPASTDKQLREMLQALLAERFKLEIHHEQRPMPVYALVAGKRGAKLTESPADADAKSSCKLQTPQQRTDQRILRTYTCTQTPIARLAEILPRVAAAYVDLPVVDLTGLAGNFDFTLEWTPRRGGRGGAGAAAAPAGDVPVASDPDALTIFDALQKQLGLKLEARKHPMDTIVIDKVERAPAEQ